MENNKGSDCYLGYIDNVPATSIILSESNKFMWPDIVEGESVFIGKLGVSRAYSGKNLAVEMLEFALAETRRRGKKYLRLDCYTDREYLCSLYKGFGFTLVEKREMMPGLYAALYEIKV